MKKLLIILTLFFTVNKGESQSLLGDKPASWIEDSLMIISDSIMVDTVIYAQIQDYNRLYVYSIKRFGNTFTFQQVDNIKLFTNYKAITGSMYFFGAWASMVGHDYLQKDKILHFLAGEVAGGVGYTGAKLLKIKHPIIVGVVFGSLVGAGKEYVYDHLMGKGVPSFKDGLWTAVGSTFGSFTMKIIIK